MANFEEGTRRLAIALGAVGAALAIGVVLTPGWDYVSSRGIITFLVGVTIAGSIGFTVVWGIVRLLGWTIEGFLENRE